MTLSFICYSSCRACLIELAFYTWGPNLNARYLGPLT